MKKLYAITLALLMALPALYSHDIRTAHSTEGMREWHLKGGKHLHAFFLFGNEHEVVLEQKNGNTLTLSWNELSAADRKFVAKKYAAIKSINAATTITVAQKAPEHKAKSPSAWSFWAIRATAVVLLFMLWLLFRRRFRMMPGMSLNARVFAGKWIFGKPGLLLLFSASGYFLFASGRSTLRTSSADTNPTFLDSAFTPFKPSVATRWDSKYFYVESNGIPAHNMMVGITSWQQQVPLPQCYNGSNAWSITLNPVMAATPVPVNNKHFLRGAIALAANGVPIFNPYTNTGVDAFLDGQLDQWGGHSGRADDYHYHNAPMFLEKPSGPTLPVAFALDGFAVYGSKEPDGSAMKTLDANHGHWGTDGRYHYHGTATAPYMIGQMAGVVNEDTTLQIIPQPAAKGVRPALTPLKGATITGFHPNGSNGYTLIYTLNGTTDSVVYRWTSSGAYTYDFYTASGKTTSNYQGKAPCIMPSGIRYLNAESVFRVFPNPASHNLSLALGKGIQETEILSTTVRDMNGRAVWQHRGFSSTVNLNGFRAGIYLLSLETPSGRAVRRVVVQP